VDLCEQRPTLQRVVDHLSLGAHPARVRGLSRPLLGTPPVHSFSGWRTSRHSG
jgi:hypothetical protein